MADRYWVGGTDNWNTVAGTKWSATSGGPGGASNPGAGDDVFFDANSGAGQVTVSATVNCRNLDFTGFVGNFAGSSQVNVNGNIICVPTTGYLHNGTLAMVGTSAKTIQFNGSFLRSSINQNNSTGTTTFLDNALTTGTITTTVGSLFSGGFSILCTTFASSFTNTRTVDIQGSTITCNAWQFTNTPNLTFLSAGSTIEMVGTTWNGGNTIVYDVVNVYQNLSFNTGTATYNVLNFNGIADKGALITRPQSGGIINTWNINGNSTVNRLFVRSIGLGNVVNITVNTIIGGGNFDIRDINLLGAFGGDVSLLPGGTGDCGGNTGRTFTPAVTNYWVGNTGSSDDVNKWANASGGTPGTGRIPLPQDTVIYDANSITVGGQTITIDMPRIGFDNDFSAVANNPTITLGATQREIFGSWVNGTMVFTQYNSLNFYGRGVQTITCNGVNFNGAIQGWNIGGGLFLNDDLIAITGSNTGYTFFNAQGHTSTNGYTLDITGINSTTAQLRSFDISNSIINIHSFGGSSTFFSIADITLNATNSLIRIVGPSANVKVIFLGGCTLNHIQNSAVVNTSPVDMLDSGTQTLLDLTIDDNKLMRLQNGLTLQIQNLNINASAGNEPTLTSMVGNHFLSKIGPGTIVVDYANIQNSHCVQADKFYATNSNDLGNNVNWNFGPPPPPMTNTVSKIFFM